MQISPRAGAPCTASRPPRARARVTCTRLLFFLVLSLSALFALSACAPTVDGPAERQRALDREDGVRLAAQLSALPGVTHSDVVLHRPIRDPLAPRAASSSAASSPAPTGGASILILVDDRADRASVTAAARALAGAVAPGISPAIVVEVAAIRPTLARVGPFTVEQSSKRPLQAALGLALAVVAGLAGWLAWTSARRRRASSASSAQRRGNSAQ